VCVCVCIISEIHFEDRRSEDEIQNVKSEERWKGISRFSMMFDL